MGKEITDMADLDWKLVRVLSHALGASPEITQKWSERRRIPHKWRLPLVIKSEGMIPMSVFVEPDGRPRP